MIGNAAKECSTDWLIWQLADSAFPTGAFAHSGGLEAAFQHGEVRGRAELREFIDASVAQAGTTTLPFVAGTFDAAAPFAEVDASFDVFTLNHVANQASRLQGRAFLLSVARAFSHPAITALDEEIRAHDFPGHFACVVGAVGRALNLKREECLRLFLFTQIRGWISSAVRLGIIGPIEGQSIQASLSPQAEAALDRADHCPWAEAAQTAPLADLFQATHDRLYSRLFQS